MEQWEKQGQIGFMEKDIPSWFDMKTLYGQVKEIKEEINQQELDESVDRVIKLIEDEKKLVSPDKLFVAGFSQGCIVTLATLMKYKGEKIAGFAGFGGAMALKIDKIPDHIQSTPLFLYHGESDECIATTQCSYEIFAPMKNLTHIIEHSVGHELKLHDFFIWFNKI